MNKFFEYAALKMVRRIEPVQLDAPVISLTENVVSWSAIEHTSSYSVFIDSEAGISTSSTSYTLTGLTTGVHTVKVKAIGNGSTYLDSEYSNEVSYTQGGQLATPVISLSGSTITWSPIPYADRYTIYAFNTDEEEIWLSSATSPYTIPEDLIYEIGHGIFTFKIKARASEETPEYSDSEYSNAVTYTIEPLGTLDTPVLTISGPIVSWTPVANADTMRIHVITPNETVDMDNGPEGPFDISIYWNTPGIYTVSAIAKSMLYADSSPSNTVTYTRYVQLDTPVISIEGTVISWSAIPNAASYLAKYHIGSTSGTQPLSASLTSVDISSFLVIGGVYTFELQAIGSGYYTDSADSNTVSYTNYVTCKTPTNLSITNTTLSWYQEEPPIPSNYIIHIVKPDSTTQDITQDNNRSYEFSSILSDIGTYTFTVKAHKDGQYYIDSAYSSAVSYTLEDYLSFTAVDANSTIAMQLTGTSPVLNLYYSTDRFNWTSFIVGTTTITLTNVGDTVYMKGSNNKKISESTSNFNQFIITGKVSCNGDIRTLYNGNTTPSSMTSSYGTLYKLFKTCPITTAPKLFPLLGVGQSYKYGYMFDSCTLLTTAPELPSTTLPSQCYAHMFDSCTSLTTAPKLPATTLGSKCYDYMFAKCTSLTTPPALPATTLADSCYRSMFSNCTSLQVSDTQTTEAPYAWKIPESGTFTNTYAQSSMFTNCLGTRSSDDMAGASGSSYTYYTQNPPITDTYTINLISTTATTSDQASIHGQYNGTNWSIYQPEIKQATQGTVMYFRCLRDEYYNQVWGKVILDGVEVQSASAGMQWGVTSLQSSYNIVITGSGSQADPFVFTVTSV